MGCPLTIGARTSGRKLSENDQCDFLHTNYHNARENGVKTEEKQVENKLNIDCIEYTINMV